MWTLFWSVIFCMYAYVNFRGYDEAVPEKYRQQPGRKKRQRRIAICEFLIGILGFAFFAVEKMQIDAMIRPIRACALACGVLLVLCSHELHSWIEKISGRKSV